MLQKQRRSARYHVKMYNLRQILMTERFWVMIQSELPLKQPVPPVARSTVSFQSSHVSQIPSRQQLCFPREFSSLNPRFNNNPDNPQPLLDNF